MSGKIFLWLLAILLLTTAPPAQAQQPKKVYRIGYLSAQNPARESARAESIRLALRELGYIEGQNIAIQYRYADGKFDRAPELAAELVRLRVDIIVVSGGARLIHPAKNATRTSRSLWWVKGSIRLKRALLKALPVPAAISPALQCWAEN